MCLAMEEGRKMALTGGGGVSGGGGDVGVDEQGGSKKGKTKGLAQTMGAGADDVLEGGEPVEQMTEEEEQESDDEVDVRVCPPPPPHPVFRSVVLCVLS